MKFIWTISSDCIKNAILRHDSNLFPSTLFLVLGRLLLNRSTSTSYSSNGAARGRTHNAMPTMRRHTMHFSGRWQAIHLIASSNDCGQDNSSIISPVVPRLRTTPPAAAATTAQLNYVVCHFRISRYKWPTRFDCTRSVAINLMQPISHTAAYVILCSCGWCWQPHHTTVCLPCWMTANNSSVKNMTISFR